MAQQLLPASAAIALCAVFATAAHGQEGCQCDFGDRSYSAVGTRAACNAFVYDAKRCEVAFSSIGASPTVMSRLPAPASEDVAYRIALEHVAALKNHDYAALSNEKFLKEALPLLMRSAYARESTWKVVSVPELDKVAMEFVEKFTPQIAAIFAGKAPSANGTFGPDYRYQIHRGRIVLITPKNAQLTVVVFVLDK